MRSKTAARRNVEPRKRSPHPPAGGTRLLEGSKASLYLQPSASMTKYLSRPGTSGIVGSGRRHKLHFYVIPMEKGRAGSRMLFQKILLCYIYCLLGTSLHFCPLIWLPHDALRAHSSIRKFIIINKSSIFHPSPWYHAFQPQHLPSPPPSLTPSTM